MTGILRSREAALLAVNVLIVLGVVGFLAAPVVLYFRVRRILRFLFARGDDA